MDYKRFFWALLAGSLLVLKIYFFFVYVPRAFSGEIIPNPILLTIGGLGLRWYGFLIASGVVIAYLVSEKILKGEHIPSRVIDGVVLLTLILGLVGARIGFVIQFPDIYFKNPAEIIKIWEGGLAIHGALVGGILGLLVGAKIYRQKFLVLANGIAPQVFLAMAIGRWGNFFNGEVIGRPTKVSWGMYVAKFNGYFHPVFLYESILLFLTYALYYFVVRKKFGNKFGLAYTLFVYGLIRIIVEFFRADYKPILWKFDLSHLVSFGIMILAVIFYKLSSPSFRACLPTGRRSEESRLDKRQK